MGAKTYSQAKLLGYEVIRLGHTALRKPSCEIKDDEFGTKDLMEFVRHMEQTFNATSAVGLAAPQVGVNEQIFLTGIPEELEKRYILCNYSPLREWVNPSYEIVDPTLLVCIEACLSVPGYVGLVARPKSIKTKSLDRSGKVFTDDLVGYNARVFLHEYDHLRSTLYTDKLSYNPQGYMELYESDSWKTLEEEKRKRQNYEWLERYGLRP